jgi:putative membrane protein
MICAILARAMNLVTQLFAIVAVLFHVVAFVLESFLFHRPNVQTFLLGRPEPSAGVRLWAFNQGFYNLFLAAGPAAGLIAEYAGNQSVGRGLVIYGCTFMAACGVVLFMFRSPVVAQHDRPERTAAHCPHRGARVAPTIECRGGTARTQSRDSALVAVIAKTLNIDHRDPHGNGPFCRLLVDDTAPTAGRGDARARC